MNTYLPAPFSPPVITSCLPPLGSQKPPLLCSLEPAELGNDISAPSAEQFSRRLLHIRQSPSKTEELYPVRLHSLARFGVPRSEARRRPPGVLRPCGSLSERSYLPSVRVLFSSAASLRLLHLTPADPWRTRA